MKDRKNGRKRKEEKKNTGKLWKKRREREGKGKKRRKVNGTEGKEVVENGGSKLEMKGEEYGSERREGAGNEEKWEEGGR